MLCSGIVFVFFFLQKLQREDTEAHTLTLACPASLAEVGPGYWLKKDESDCHLPFLLFVDCQTLSAVSRAAGEAEGGLVVGRMKRGREGGNPSLCRNRARVFLKQALLTSYFHFLQTTCAIVSGHSYPPRAPRRGKRRGNPTKHILCEATEQVLNWITPWSFWLIKKKLYKGRNHSCITWGFESY